MDNFKNRWEPKTSSTDVNNEVILEVARKLPSELHCKCQYIGAQLHMHAHIYPYIYMYEQRHAACRQQKWFYSVGIRSRSNKKHFHSIPKYSQFELSFCC